MENIVKAAFALLFTVLVAACGFFFSANSRSASAQQNSTPQYIVVTATPAPAIVTATPASIEGCSVVSFFTNASWQSQFASGGQEGIWTKFSLEWFEPDTILWIEGPFNTTTAAPLVRLTNQQWFIPYRERNGEVEPVGIFQRSSSGMRHEFSLGEVIKAMSDAFINDWLTIEGFFLAPQSCAGKQLNIEPLISHLVLPQTNREQLGWDYFSLRDAGMHYPAGLTVDD